MRPLFGPGGRLGGDGLDAAENCEGSACNGGNAGLLWGNGGDGAQGGTGGNGGFFFGNGGIGGNGVDAVYDEITGERTAPTAGGRGGNAGMFGTAAPAGSAAMISTSRIPPK